VGLLGRLRPLELRNRFCSALNRTPLFRQPQSGHDLFHHIIRGHPVVMQ
jgi:hypothetical protein